MPSTRRTRNGLLARVNFPLYTVQMLTSRYILVGGGGGSSHTGVANGFEIFELSHDGKHFVVEEVMRHETGPTVVMNCATFSDNKHAYLVAGQESHCQLYNVQSVVVTENDEHTETPSENGVNHVRHRRNSKTQPKPKTDNNNKNNNKRLKFLIKPNDSIQTDFLKEEPLQRVIRINHNGKLMATGGTDACVRLWQFPSLKSSFTLKSHQQEIDDLDFSPLEPYLVSVAKDGLAIIWNYTTGKEVRKLTWQQPEGLKYLFKRCRFGIIEEEKRQTAVYTITNPISRSSKQVAYLQKWSTAEGNLIKVAPVNESLSALAVRDDGRFVAVGTMFSGSVSIYIAFSLQRAFHIPGAHSMFVTGLEFLPSSDTHSVASISEAAVVSISVDNQVCIHSLPYRRTVPLWVAIIVIFITLFLTFVICSYVGL